MTFVGIGDTPITLSGHAVGQIAELLEHCEAFLRHASPNTRAAGQFRPHNHPLDCNTSERPDSITHGRATARSRPAR